MDLRNTDPEVRQQLEEGEHQGRGRNGTHRQRDNPLLAHGFGGKFRGTGASGSTRGITQNDLGACDDSRFDMHDPIPPVTSDNVDTAFASRSAGSQFKKNGREPDREKASSRKFSCERAEKNYGRRRHAGSLT